MKIIQTLACVCLHIFTAILMNSCVGHKDLVYLKGKKNTDFISYKMDSISAYTLSPGDKIGVQVINNAGTEVDMFNKQSLTPQGASASQQQLSGYDVDPAGNIDLPMIGVLHIKGMTITQVDSLIEVKLQEYITFSYVKTAILSFRVTMLGEFRNPQTISSQMPNINILQAIGYAGDFTDLANKTRVKVYRKKGEVYEMQILNMSGDNIFKFQQFYLLPNDIVYVEPLKVKTIKVNSPTVSIFISVLAFALVLVNYVQ